MIRSPQRGLRAAAAAGLAALALASASAAAAPARSTSAKRPRRAPSWSRVAPGPCPRPFPETHLCAVGKAEGMRSEAGREAAVTRARTALAGAVEKARGGTPPGGGEAPVSRTLEGSSILAVHQAGDGTWYALAAIEAAARPSPPPR